MKELLAVRASISLSSARGTIRNSGCVLSREASLVKEMSGGTVLNVISDHSAGDETIACRTNRILAEAGYWRLPDDLCQSCT